MAAFVAAVAGGGGMNRRSWLAALRRWVGRPRFGDVRATPHEYCCCGEEKLTSNFVGIGWDVMEGKPMKAHTRQECYILPEEVEHESERVAQGIA